ncbi:MAG: efflux RND transporter periplasmic adaptor subunit [Pseudomonadota bacterium]
MNFKAMHTVLAATLAVSFGAQAAPPATNALASAPVASSASADAAAYDGVVQAVRQTVLAAQVPGAVVALPVKAGDAVKAGQVLLRLDARAAEQQAGAAAAQVLAARAMQEAATKEFERQKQLFQKNYISQAALDRAEAQYKATQAEAAAQLAAAGAARTQSGFYVVKAPYAGIVSEVSVVLGDMALPGRPLLTLYDPAALRVSAAVPQTAAARLAKGQALQAELPGTAGRITPTRWQLLPAVDPATHTLELRLELPDGTAAAPGMFARAWLPGGNAEAPRLSVPASAVVRRAELTGVYVIGADGRPLLRQVRLGRASGEQVEVLSGLGAGERVALDPQAAARVR